jgi:hypothetical protein
MNSGPNPLIGWQVDPTTIHTIGHDLSRPECILAEPDGSLWTADGLPMVRGVILSEAVCFKSFI